MTADILHAGFNIFKFSLKKKDAVELGGVGGAGAESRSKKNPGSIYKNVPQYVDDGSKNKRKK